MTYEDAFLLSLGVNIGLVFLNHRVNQRYHELGEMFVKLMVVVTGVADSEVEVKRGSDGNIHIKEKANG
jgi:hypothetical protein